MSDSIWASLWDLNISSCLITLFICDFLQYIVLGSFLDDLWDHFGLTSKLFSSYMLLLQNSGHFLSYSQSTSMPVISSSFHAAPVLSSSSFYNAQFFAYFLLIFWSFIASAKLYFDLFWFRYFSATEFSFKILLTLFLN